MHNILMHEGGLDDTVNDNAQELLPNNVLRNTSLEERIESIPVEEIYIRF